VIPGWFVILAGLATILPYLLVPVIPGTDYPNDLARLAILGAAPGAAIRQSFVPHWALMPDLGLDLVYMALKSVASPACVLRLCLAGAMASMLSLIWLIQRDLFGRPSFAAALAIPCMGGLPVVLGFTNFVMSSALVLLGVWLWLRWRENLSWPRVLALAAVSALTWLCHVAGYALLMAFLGCGQFWLFARRPSLASLFRNAASLAVITLPGLVLFGFAERETVPLVNVAWRSYAIRGLFAPTMVTGDPSDLLIWLGMVVIIGVILAKGRWFVAPPARLSLAVLAFIIAALPWSVGAATDVGTRLVTPFFLLCLAASRATPPAGAIGRHVMMGVLGLIIAWRDLTFVALAREEARTVSAFREAARSIPQGATLFQATDKWRDAHCKRASVPQLPVGQHAHLAAYATIDRGVWEPLIFTAKGKQPIRSVRDFAPGELHPVPPPGVNNLPGQTTGIAPDGDEIPAGFPERFGYLLVVGRGCTANPIPSLLSPLRDGPGFSLYRIKATQHP
jgi:hypothetical protein